MRAALDAPQLRRAVPGLQHLDAKTNGPPHSLKPACDRYVLEVSSADMAVSWETSRFLWFAASSRACRSVLDLGSGFSSCVLRAWALQSSSLREVVSVDDDPYWLEQTGAFLTQSALPADHLLTCQAFRESWRRGFDLVFHDLGDITLRAGSLPYVLGPLNDGGMIVLDDMQNRRYRRIAGEALRRAGLVRCSARRFTLDTYGRFAEVGIRVAHGSAPRRDPRPAGACSVND